MRKYPVKSMLGTELPSALVTERGLQGDRERAVLDVATGKIASAKNPRLWRDLLTLDGSRPPGDEELSKLLGREVRLIDTVPDEVEFERSIPEEVLAQGIEAEVGYTMSHGMAGSFLDFAPIHVVTTATLDWLGMDAVRYRPNLVIDTPDREYGWPGRTLRIGAEVELEVMVATPRCAIPTLAHGDLPRDTDALRLPARHNRIEVYDLGPQPCVGVYARVSRAGTVRTGDPAELLPPRAGS
ncbi:MAG: MOSC domain-containing protein [Nonomuraea sp.]|nr:MOSC domain-containing protein [Nonomuraea sp.]